MMWMHFSSESEVVMRHGEFPMQHRGEEEEEEGLTRTLMADLPSSRGETRATSLLRVKAEVYDWPSLPDQRCLRWREGHLLPLRHHPARPCPTWQQQQRRRRRSRSRTGQTRGTSSSRQGCLALSW